MTSLVRISVGFYSDESTGNYFAPFFDSLIGMVFKIIDRRIEGEGLQKR